ncbi:MAG: VOC family protein [Terracidiphilus sp.]
MKNRSVPAETVLPHVTYKDLPAAISWLGRTFGFVEHYRYGQPPSGAQVHLGDAWIMLNAARGAYRSPSELGFGTQSLTVFVEDVEAHFARTKSTGALIVEDLHETEYGELQYGVRDLEGHLWLFSRHARDMSPDAWGATLVNPL